MSSHRYSSRAIQSVVMMSLLLPGIPLPARIRAHAGLGDQPAAQVNKIRSLAESQHEIVVLLIKKKEFDQALVEANKIFEMNWPADQEPILLKELLFIGDQFLHNGQAALGIKLIETNLKAFKVPVSQAAIWKEKGYLYKSMGEADRALECFRQAQRLEK